MKRVLDSNSHTMVRPDHHHTPDDHRMFVFGSNRLGIHGAGAAAYAAQIGAVQGLGEGPSGNTYALPTCSVPGVGLPLEEVRRHVELFKEFARRRPDVTFFVSEVGCGHAGHRPEDIAPMFRGSPANCHLPPNWER